MSDRSHLYNNAGVQVLMADTLGHHRMVALELFRGALESKLAYERQHQDPLSATAMLGVNSDDVAIREGHVGDAGDEQQRCVTPELSECLSQAEMHLQNLEMYLTPATVSNVDTQPPESLAVGSSGTTATVPERWVSHVPDTLVDTITVPIQSRGYDPYVHVTPFQIPDPPASTQVISSVIVYNLGLVHQIVSRESPKTAAFYEISAALLSSLPEGQDTLLLRISLLNNFGVWCFENGDGESMRTCMEHLQIALQDADLDGACVIDPVLKQGIMNNIRWLLTPLHGGSPAA